MVAAASSVCVLFASPYQPAGSIRHAHPPHGRTKIETGTAYHALPESHMKGAIQMPKWHAPKYLRLAYFS